MSLRLQHNENEMLGGLPTKGGGGGVEGAWRRTVDYAWNLTAYQSFRKRVVSLTTRALHF